MRAEPHRIVVTLASINPNLCVMKSQSFESQIAGNFSQERILSQLTMLFGGLALLLATLGSYGVTAYGVARRTSEIGIRMAPGAERTTVTAMVMRGAMVQGWRNRIARSWAALAGWIPARRAASIDPVQALRVE